MEMIRHEKHESGEPEFASFVSLDPGGPGRIALTVDDAPRRSGDGLSHR